MVTCTLESSQTLVKQVEVGCMAKVGINRFFWPAWDDIPGYLILDIVSVITPPKPVTSYHMEIDKEIWAKLQNVLGEVSALFFRSISHD